MEDPIERMLTAAGVRGLSFVGCEGSREYQVHAAADIELVISRLAKVRDGVSQALERMYFIDGKAEEIVGDPCFELRDALTARYTAHGKSDITVDPAIESGIEVADAASRAFLEEFNRHIAALNKIDKAMPRGFRSLVKTPLPAARSAQPMRLAANQSGLNPYSKRGPARKAKLGATRKRAVRRKR